MSAPRVGRCVSPRRPAGRSRPALPAASATPGRAASCRPARASAARRASSAPGGSGGWLRGWRQCTQTSVNNRNNNKIRIFSMKLLHAPDQTTAHVANKTPAQLFPPPVSPSPGALCDFPFPFPRAFPFPRVSPFPHVSPAAPFPPFPRGSFPFPRDLPDPTLVGTGSKRRSERWRGVQVSG